MVSQCNSVPAISCQTWPHPWWYRASWHLGYTRGVSGMNVAQSSEEYLPSPGLEKTKEDKPSVVSFCITLTPATFLLPWTWILVHRWAINQSEAFARALIEEQKCPQGFKGVLGHCSAWGLQRYAAMKCLVSCQVLAWPTHFWWVPEHHYSETGWAGGNRGFHRTGTTQLPAFLPGPQDELMSEKGLFVEAALGAVSASNPEHLTYLFGSSSSLQDLSHSQVVQLLAFPFAVGT